MSRIPPGPRLLAHSAVMDESFTTPELFDLAVAYVRYVWLHAGVDTAPIPVCGVARGPGPLAAMSGCANP